MGRGESVGDEGELVSGVFMQDKNPIIMGVKLVIWELLVKL